MNAITKARGETFKMALTQIAKNIQATLPPHVPFEKFERVTLMAVQKDPKLLESDLRSLLLELQKAATDGLLPDGREAVIVRRWNSKAGGEVATYQPMVAGLMKLARQSGEIASINAHVVYEGEKFSVILGDEDRIEHERNIDLVGKAPPIAVYAVARLKNGEIVREVLSASQVMEIRNVNKHWQKGPWGGPFADEMWRKSAIRRLSKRLPTSTDRDGEAFTRAVERVDTIYNFDGEASEVHQDHAASASRLDAIESQISNEEPSPNDEPPHDAETGEIIPPTAQDWVDELIREFQTAKNAAALTAMVSNAAIRAKMTKLKQENPERAERLNDAYLQRQRDFAGAA